MRIGVVGIGSIGKRHVTNLLEMGKHEILGYDTRVGKDGWTVGLPIQAVSDRLMLWDYKPEVVLICTPPVSHAPLALEAMEYEAHCFIEKPLACYNWEVSTPILKARAKKLHLAVGYQLRFHKLGIERHFNNQVLDIVHAQDMSAWPSWYQKDVLEEFSHEIDLACFLNGPVDKVVARQSDNGLKWNIELKHLQGMSNIQICADSTTYKRWIVDASGGSWTFKIKDNDQAYKDELRAFLNVCQGGPWDERLCSGAEAAHVVRIIEACRESARECKVVTLA